jgi:hypothetical protein
MLCCTYEEWWFRADGEREARSVIDVISLAATGILMLMATRLGLQSIEFEIPEGAGTCSGAALECSGCEMYLKSLGS